MIFVAEHFTNFIHCVILGSNSTPVEDRLLKHLLDPEYQSHNLMTTPAEDRHKPVELFFAVVLLKLISLVAYKLLMLLYDRNEMKRNRPMTKQVDY